MGLITQFGLMNNSKPVLVEIPNGMSDYADTAILRLGYLSPEWVIRRQGDLIEVSSDSELDPKRVRIDLLHAIYRQKIFAETVSLRAELINMLTRK